MRLVNYQDHPTNDYYQVFFFKNMERGEYFEKLLEDEGIYHEKQIDDESDPPVLYIGVKRNQFDRALKCNYLAAAKFRQPFISNRLLGWALIIFVGIVIGLALWRAIIT